MFKKLPSTALRKVLTSTGPHVCSLQAAPMPIPRPARRFTSRAFYAGTMIYSLIDRLIHWRGSALVPAGAAGWQTFLKLVQLCFRVISDRPPIAAAYQVPNLSISEDL